MRATSVQVPETLYQEAMELARQERTSLGRVVREALTAYCRNHHCSTTPKGNRRRPRKVITLEEWLQRPPGSDSKKARMGKEPEACIMDWDGDDID